ncbi:hypothetical protein FRUB_05650 [Fimbriiglobus ruber]|uniref:Uncharacterized protein n=1 Tax=Fimbriiglobus ruber TaxID=1908690 RepID=A0A225DDY4_9BACT|nr:hypothetical protein FRUB_05650 [Fimbriiglobus ruber]
MAASAARADVASGPDFYLHPRSGKPSSREPRHQLLLPVGDDT